jgi:hypothetical protein
VDTDLAKCGRRVDQLKHRGAGGAVDEVHGSRLYAVPDPHFHKGDLGIGATQRNKDGERVSFGRRNSVGGRRIRRIDGNKTLPLRDIYRLSRVSAEIERVVGGSGGIVVKRYRFDRDHGFFLPSTGRFPDS